VKILLRPLVERLGTFTYLIEHPESLDVWEQGWTFKTRPRFPELLRTLHGPGEPPPDRPRLLADRFHSLVHGDPTAAGETLITRDDGRPGFMIGKDLNSPHRAEQVCAETCGYLLTMLARTAQLFPEAGKPAVAAVKEVAAELDADSTFAG
jgi:hypothetical protein